MKKALTGPAKRTAKKKPERRGIVAAAARRIRAASERLDRRASRALVATWPLLAGAGRRARAVALAWARRAGRLLRPWAVRLFRLLARLERRLLGLAARARRAAGRAWAEVTPQRAICTAILLAAGCLLVVQFLDYRAIEVGGPAYAGLPAASAPTVGARTAGAAHAYLLVPLALLAAALALAALRKRRRRRLGRLVFALGAIALSVVLLVDLPAGQDVGAQASRFAAAQAVLYAPFYVELAAAVALMLGGLLLANAHRFRTGHGYRLRKRRPATMRRLA